MRLALLFHNFGPYHLARLSASLALGKKKGVTVFGLETARNSDAYRWITEAGEIRNYIYTLASGHGQNGGHKASIISQTWLALNHLRPEALAICGYDRWEMLTGMAWAKSRGKVLVFMSDSKADDYPRNFLKETIKSCLVKRFDAALVAGRPQKEYVVSLGIPAERVFMGYDVVDNGYFARGTTAARDQEAKLLKELKLPVPYFLTACRFIEEKNLVRLLSAYRLYRHLHPGTPWDLVMCGSGPLGDKLQETAGGLIEVHFPGFKQADDLPAYYALAQALILPSISETWGLVVNEAMASGLPVLVSTACGCAQDLVQDGVNGFTFDPYDVEGLARLMVRMSSGEVDLQAMGEASRRIIADWTPEVFAQNLFKAVEAAQEAKQSKKWWSGRA